MRGHYRTKTETNGLNHFLQTLMILTLVMVVLMGQTLAFSPPGAYFLRSTSVTTTSCLFASAYVDDPVDDDAIGQELNKKKTVVVAGATGYIGRAVVQESVRRGYHTVALVRNSTKIEETLEGQHTYGMAFKGAAVHECDVEDRQKLLSVFKSCPSPIDSVISCLAAPSGTKKDVLAIDYQATLNCLETGQLVNARHFVLLSAFCCRNPLLQLQQAKLKCEAELANQTKMTWTSVRPTAFFKSVSGQLEAVKAGAPYVLFGDGAVTKCNPIAETELADFMMNCLTDESKRNRIVNVGGPDDPLTNRNLGEMMFQAIGREPRFVFAPTWFFDYIIHALEFLAKLLDYEALENATETARIGKYYAVESMLTTDPNEKYGKITMQDHYNKIAAEGQDEFTPIRATAVIGRILETIPGLSFSIPTLYALSHSKVMQTATDDPHKFDFSMVIASFFGNV